MTSNTQESKLYLDKHDVLTMQEAMADPEKKALHTLVKSIEIDLRNAVHYGHRDLLWSLPTYNPDLPVFDRGAMIIKLAKHFQGQGFFVAFHRKSNFVYISWRSK